MTSDRAALALATLAILLLTVMDSLVKSLSASFSALELVFLRNASGLVFAGAVFAALRPGWPTLAQLGGHALRATIMFCTSLMFFFALGRMPLAELFVYTFTAPMFVALLGALMLKERLTGPVALGLALGFAGIVAIVATDPDARFGGGDLLGRAAALLSPITYALGIVLLRRQAGGEPVARIVFVQSLLLASATAPLAAAGALPQVAGLAAADLWKVAGLGLLGTTGGLLLAAAFKRADAGKVAVSEYTGLIWAAIIGWLAFAETPRSMVFVGGVLVIAGCVVVARGRGLKPGVA